jgi:hypothetical protein
VNKISATQLFSIANSAQFEQVALDIFHYQAAECRVYAEFIRSLGLEAASVRSIPAIPFLPVEFFKSHKIISGDDKVDIVFSSSSTGGVASKHFVRDPSVYQSSFREGFKKFYGDISKYTILALLPSYLEREGSSLIYMVSDLIEESGSPKSGYFLYNHEDLFHALQHLQENHVPTILIGVTYALLDFAEKYRINYPDLIIMETGGMKGKRKELIREELHEILCKKFGVETIHSEYGMAEMLSQAYSKGNGMFHCPPWMQIRIRDINDPLSSLSAGQTGGINVIDLANLNSCAFIATQDIGKIHQDGSFEVLGRFDNSDIRGCNMLVQ